MDTDVNAMTEPASTTAKAPPQVWPVMRARDAYGMIRFLESAFGFRAVAVYGNGDRVEHAELAWPLGGGIMLGSATEDGSKPPKPGSSAAYVVTNDPDALCARAQAAGATISRELHETDYGSRDFSVTDPEGNHWYFSTFAGVPQD